MKAISLKQPWGGLIAGGFKTIETRKWRTHYRGDLLICSSQKPVPINQMGQEFYLEPLCHYVGSTICLVNLVDCVPMTEEHEEAAMCRVYDGAWAWMLEDIRPVKQIPVKGQLSIFDVPFTYEDLKA